MLRWKKFRLNMLIWSLLVLFAFAGAIPVDVEATTAFSLTVNRPLPEITVYDWDGTAKSLKPEPGRALYVVWWGWHPMEFYGRAALYVLNEVAEEYKAAGVDIVAIHDQGNFHAAEWLRHMDFSFQTLWAEPGQFQAALRYNPSRFGVDSSGIVKIVEAGFDDRVVTNLTMLRNELNSLVSGVPPALQGKVPILPPVGSTLPDFLLPDFEKAPLDSRSLEEPLCLLFWFSDCSYARGTIERLLELFPEFNARGVKFVTINLTEDIAIVRNWLSSNPLPFINLRDEFGLVSDRFGVYGVPTMIVADKNGLVTFAGSGDYIHGANLRAVLEAVAGPPIPGGWPGQPGSPPLTDQEELAPLPGDFGHLVVKGDQLLGEARTAALATGLQETLNSLYEIFEIEPGIFAGTDSYVQFYANPVRYYHDSQAPCNALGYCIADLNNSSIRMYVQWVTDLETTLIVARHELIHALIKLKSGGVPPLWFDEGCADALSRLHPPDYTSIEVIAGSGKRPTPVRLEAMWHSEDPFERYDAREISHAVVNFIIHKYGLEGLNSIFTAFAGSESFPTALQQGLGITLDGLMAEFWRDVPAAARRAGQHQPLFSDLNTAEVQVEFLVKLGAIGGFSDGTFRPWEPMTRQEFARMLVSALDVPEAIALNLSDPTGELTNAEALTMLVRAVGLVPLGGNENTFFADTEQIPPWALKYVTEAALQGIIYWNPQEALAPGNPLARADAATWMYNAYRYKRSTATLRFYHGVAEYDSLLPQGAPGAPDPSSGGSDPGQEKPADPKRPLWPLLAGGIAVVALLALFLAVKNKKSIKA